MGEIKAKVEFAKLLCIISGGCCRNYDCKNCNCWELYKR